MQTRSLPLTLALTALLLGSGMAASRAIAGTCAAGSCAPRRILQFVPGQQINVQVINRTASLVEIQKVENTDPVPLRPGQELNFVRGGGTKPNISVIFWDATALPLRSRISKPSPNTLRIELNLAPSGPGDRSVYIRDDGRVAVF